MPSNKHLLYPDILRLLASFLVVGVHVCASSIDELPLSGVDFFIANALDCLSILGVPLFVMLSGALELSRPAPEDEAGEKKEMGKAVKKALYLMGLYFFWLCCYNLLNCYYEGYGFSAGALKEHVLLESLLGRGIYHLWFLPMLAGLTLALPILRPAAKSRRLSVYFLGLYLIFTIVLPTILKFQYRFPYYEVVEGLYSRIPYVVITGFTGYFLLGHHLAIHVPPLEKKHLFPLFAGFFLSWTAGQLICFYDSQLWGQPSVILNDPYALTDFIAAACLFLFVKTLTGALPQRAPEGIARLSSCTLGIYLLHPALLMIASHLGLTTLLLPQAVSIPLWVMVIWGLSLLITLGLKQIPGVRMIL